MGLAAGATGPQGLGQGQRGCHVRSLHSAALAAVPWRVAGLEAHAVSIQERMAREGVAVDAAERQQLDR